MAFPPLKELCQRDDGGTLGLHHLLALECCVRGACDSRVVHANAERGRMQLSSVRVEVRVADHTRTIYEDRCSKCGKAFERQQHIAEHEKSHPRCPKCQSPVVQPVLTDFYAKPSKKS